MERQLIDYLPEDFLKFYEFQTIFGIEQNEYSALWAATEAVCNELFLDTALNYGVSRWEKMLGLQRIDGQTLQERKLAIKIRFTEKLPYTLRHLERQLSSIIPQNKFELSLEEYVLKVTVYQGVKASEQDISDMIRRILPANMAFELNYKYNRHLDLERFTHENLEKYTHKELREEDLNQS